MIHQWVVSDSGLSMFCIKQSVSENELSMFGKVVNFWKLLCLLPFFPQGHVTSSSSAATPRTGRLAQARRTHARSWKRMLHGETRLRRTQTNLLRPRERWARRREGGGGGGEVRHEREEEGWMDKGKDNQG